MPIRVLPPELAIKIAAGEVVERPAAIVKELLDNAIDAGAATIRIEVRTGGQDFIRVIDDGSGIPAGEVELAFQRHATSKISELADLFRIQTMGFRGEALPSIASVSRMSMVSRTEGERDGTEVIFEGGVMTANEPRVAPRGTIVTVRDLFYNVPARQKFLKAPAQETAAISQIVSQYALAYPHLHITLVAENRTSFQSPGTGSLLDAIRAVYGAEIGGAMLPVGQPPAAQGRAGEQEEASGAGGQPPSSSEADIAQVWGYVSRPDVSRGNRQYINFFVNQRPIASQSLSYAAEDTYRTLLMTGRHPIVVLNIELDPRMVDANMHPQKVEVKFADERSIFTNVQQSVHQALAGYSAVPNLNPSRAGTERGGDEEAEQEELSYGPTYEARPIPQVGRRQDEATDAATLHASRSVESGGRDDGEQGSADRAFDELALGSETEQSALPHTIGQKEQRSAGGQVVESRRQLPPLRIVGQVTPGYIVCEGPEGMYILDQHRADERVRYERILAGLDHPGAGINRVILPHPLTVALAEGQTEELAVRRAAFAGLGFALAIDGQAAVFTAVPEMLSAAREERMVEAIGVVVADGLRQQNAKLWLDTLAISLACHSAAANAEQLDTARARELVAELEGSHMPRACAHGLPTLLLVSKAQLVRVQTYRILGNRRGWLPITNQWCYNAASSSRGGNKGGQQGEGASERA